MNISRVKFSFFSVSRMIHQKSVTEEFFTIFLYLKLVEILKLNRRPSMSLVCIFLLQINWKKQKYKSLVERKSSLLYDCDLFLYYHTSAII